MKWFKCQEDGNDYIWILFREKGGGDEIHRVDGNWAETFWMKTNFLVSWSIPSATFGPHIITLYPHTHIRHCIYTHHPPTRSTPHLWHSGRMKVFSNKSFRFPNEEIFPFFFPNFLVVWNFISYGEEEDGRKWGFWVVVCRSCVGDSRTPMCRTNTVCVCVRREENNKSQRGDRRGWMEKQFPVCLLGNQLGGESRLLYTGSSRKRRVASHPTERLYPIWMKEKENNK